MKNEWMQQKNNAKEYADYDKIEYTFFIILHLCARSKQMQL